MKKILTLITCISLICLGGQIKTQGQEADTNLIAGYYSRGRNNQVYRRGGSYYPSTRSNYYRGNYYHRRVIPYHRGENHWDCYLQCHPRSYYPSGTYYRPNYDQTPVPYPYSPYYQDNTPVPYPYSPYYRSYPR